MKLRTDNIRIVNETPIARSSKGAVKHQ